MKDKNLKSIKKNDPTMIQIATVSFKFSMTRDEAFEVLKNPRGKVAKEFRRYMADVVEATAKKVLKTPKGEDISHEKINIKES